MKTILAAAILFISNCIFAQFGKDGALTLSTNTTIVNQYASISNNISIGQNTISVTSIADLNTPLNLTCGDLLLIYQSQGADMITTNNSNYGSISNYNSAGFFELKHVSSVNGNTITLNSTTTNSYSISGKTQVVKVPQYLNLTINSSAVLSSTAWNGAKGGVIVIHSKDSVVLNGKIYNTGKGFKGGVARTSGYTYLGTQYVSSNIIDGGEKGEGICGHYLEYDLQGGRYCRGAPGNGGGGGTNHNAGGGGGANAFNNNTYTGAGVMCTTCPGSTAWFFDADYINNSNTFTNSSGGGKGGNSFSNSPQNPLTTAPGNSLWGSDTWRNVGGRGGRPLTNINYLNRAYFGGGGGAGDANDNSGGSGAKGGGLIILISPKITGNGNIVSNGDSAGNSTNIHADALGGGGGGGSIIINSTTLSNNLIIDAKGGKGGSMIMSNGTGYVIGTGGGGGGGYICYPNLSTATLNVTGGLTGKNYYPTISSFPQDGGTNGGTGLMEPVTNYTLVNDFNPIGTGSIGISISSNTICNGANAIITPSGATNYSLSTGAISNTNFTVTPTSTSSYTIYALNSCSPSFTTFTINVGIPPNLSVTTPIMLNCLQSTTLNATSTSSSPTFSWSGPNITSGAQTQTPTVNQIGNYTVTLTQGVCTNTAVVSVISNSNIPTIAITPTNSSICAGQTSTLIASGANTYTWSASSTLSASSGSIVIANPTSTTIYTVTGTSNTCTNSAIATVSVLSTPTVILSSNSSICQGVNSSATLTANGASTYTWVNSSTLSSSTGSIVIASPNATTNYTVTGSNSACSNTSIINVSVNPTPTITSTTFSNTSCGFSNGSATITTTASTNTYSWSSGLTSTSATVSALAAGNYSVTVYNGICQTNTVVSILSSVPLQIISNIITGSDCGVNNGSIFVTDNLVNSSYSWTPSVSSTNNLSNLSAGTYSLLITNGVCSTSTVYAVAQLNGPSAINAIQSDAICESLSGAVSVTSVLNGVGPYQFSFNNLGYSSVNTFSNLAQGIYTISVKDFNGCIYSNTVVINKVTVTSTIDLVTNLPACNTNDGSFVINNISGGTKPYNLSFNGLSYSTDTLFKELGSGNYALVIKDSNLCETSFILNMPFDKNDYTLYVPNTFTPNKDVVNDLWFVKGTCINSFNCLIFNRWGERIIELVNLTESWDGKYKGKDVPEGVYVYLIEVETNNGIIYKNGHITLFR